MEKYKEIQGDLIALAKEGTFDVIAHGCNCMCHMGAGIAPKMAQAFGCADYYLEGLEYAGDINKLGQIDYILSLPKYPRLKVVNCYTQYEYGKGKVNIDYEALTLCMRKINHTFKGKHIGLPKIGCGLAGGDWSTVRTIILHELKDCPTTIVMLK